jgi:hypothetical protein
MSIEIHCPCGRRLRLNAEAAGGQGRCPVCGRVLDLPTDRPSEPALELAPPRPGPSTALTEGPSVQRPEREATDRAEPEWEEGEADEGEADELPVLSRPEYRLASTGQVFLAAILGGPLAGFLLVAHNYGKLGRRAASWGMVFGGLLATGAAVGLGFLLLSQGRGAVLLGGVPFWVGIYFVARWLQGTALVAHKEQDGELVSGGLVFGYIVLGVVGALGPLFGCVALYNANFGDRKLQVSAEEEVLYGLDVTEAEARTVGTVLQQQGFFTGSGKNTVRLSKDGHEYVLSFVVSGGFDSPATHQYYRALAVHVARSFGGKPVQVELLDMAMISRKKLPAERAPADR